MRPFQLVGEKEMVNKIKNFFQKKKAPEPLSYPDPSDAAKAYDQEIIIQTEKMLAVARAELVCEMQDTLKNCKALVFDVEDVEYSLSGSYDFRLEVMKNVREKLMAELIATGFNVRHMCDDCIRIEVPEQDRPTTPTWPTPEPLRRDRK